MNGKVNCPDNAVIVMYYKQKPAKIASKEDKSSAKPDSSSPFILALNDPAFET